MVIAQPLFDSLRYRQRRFTKRLRGLGNYT